MTEYLSYFPAAYRVCKDVVYEYWYTDQNTDTNERIYPTCTWYDKYTTFFCTPTHIIDNLYIGSAYNAANFAQLKSFDIKVIINMTNEISNYFSNDFTYRQFQLYDNNVDDIEKYLTDIMMCIDENKDKNILVHCKIGASRSAGIVLYYLMIRHQMDLTKALEFVKEKRTIINPNNKFIESLKKVDIYMQTK